MTRQSYPGTGGGFNDPGRCFDFTNWLIYHRAMDGRKSIDPDSVREAVRGVFSADRDVVAVWGFGSFFKGGEFNDIDLAVLYRDPLGADDCLRRALDSGAALERAVPGARFDVKTLNGAPLHFQYVVVGRGDILHANDELDACRFRAAVWTRFFDFQPAWEHSNRKLAESFLHG